MFEFTSQNTIIILIIVENDFIYSPLPEGVNPKTTKLELFEVIENHIIRVSQHMKKTDSKNVAAQ